MQVYICIHRIETSIYDNNIIIAGIYSFSPDDLYPLSPTLEKRERVGKGRRAKKVSSSIGTRTLTIDCIPDTCAMASSQYNSYYYYLEIYIHNDDHGIVMISII